MFILVILGFVLVASVLPYSLRKAVGGRAKWTCEEPECGRDWRGGFMLHFHHKRPKSEGGTDAMSNLEVLCVDHHVERHQALKEEHFWNGRKKQGYRNLWAAQALDGKSRKRYG